MESNVCGYNLIGMLSLQKEGGPEITLCMYRDEAM